MTQTEEILEYMRKHGSITQLEAAKELGCFRLGARIWDLRKEGYYIKSQPIAIRNRKGKNIRFAKYSLEEF